MTATCNDLTTSDPPSSSLVSRSREYRLHSVMIVNSNFKVEWYNIQLFEAVLAVAVALRSEWWQLLCLSR
eukprot:CAMPEP_0175877046 /NCGR_PEP_ID=MMETSP0107_2-20121207/40391_1 /TAXON_ID=195067 ORGANISM="Goniomonas pacifica, Strain CCMP1869" /NCGR_SAMPLE_ID=MMETSP0107_2 /ASSEMBLY_ACC=CAM_ASM_000203 /LENGTH=69 /DNA_ID=CAMNT_0017196329 /DNA_START=15 /DNA_END=221 /DNA_ORIENTATION=+